MTSEQLFNDRLCIPSDITDHLCTLRLLARECWNVTEFGVRKGNSTIAFLAGLPHAGRLSSYDVNLPDFTPPVDAVDRWSFRQADTSKLEWIPVTDLLFIDTLHTYDQVKAELRHANQVRKWLVFHDTLTFGCHGENGQRGIAPAISEFKAENPYWRTFASCRHNNGLLILQRV